MYVYESIVIDLHNKYSKIILVLFERQKEEKMSKRKNAKSNLVKRSLYYYDFSWKVFNSPKGEFEVVKNIDRKVENLLLKFQLENKKAVDKRYIFPTENDDNVFLITDEIGENSISFRIVLCKTNALPLVEKSGTLEELEKYIDQKQNIAEVTHCVYFKDSNIIGAEYNFAGARVSTLKWYFPKVLHLDGDSDSLYQINIDARINGDAYKKLAENETLTLFELHFKPDSDAYRNVLANTSLFRGAVNSVPDAEIIEVTIKRKKKKKNCYTGLNDVLTTEQIQNLIRNYREDVKKLYVSQGAYSDGVDLLSDKLVTKVDIVKTKKRTIDSNDAYKKIKVFYEEEVKPS